MLHIRCVISTNTLCAVVYVKLHLCLLRVNLGRKHYSNKAVYCNSSFTYYLPYGT